MAGYTPWMAGAVAAAKRANAAAAARHRAEQFERYREYRAESRACGYEVESFEEWLGEASPREAAEARMGVAGRSLGDACYYGDIY
jgi:hypothetical protein